MDLIEWTVGMLCGHCGHEAERTLGPRPDKPSMQDIITVLAQAEHLDIEAAHRGEALCTVCHMRGTLWWTGVLSNRSNGVGGSF